MLSKKIWMYDEKYVVHFGYSRMQRYFRKEGTVQFKIIPGRRVRFYAASLARARILKIKIIL